jgi:hypothetical protein
METGHLVYQIHEPHGPGHEVTAVNVNTTGYRLATGAYDGIITRFNILTPLIYYSSTQKTCARVCSSYDSCLCVQTNTVFGSSLPG